MKCHRRDNVAAWYALAYCWVLGTTFVGSLYILVPYRIQRLPRHNASQIKWRSAGTLLVSVVAYTTYPLFFCDNGYDYFSLRAIHTLLLSSLSTALIARLLQHQLLACTSVLLHILILFSGPILQSLLSVYDATQRKEKTVGLLRFVSVYSAWYIYPLKAALFAPSTESERWIHLRNLIIAPLTEEVVFRACMVPALYATGWSVVRVSCLAPLWFGIAHVHHAWLKVSEGRQPIVMIVVETLVQFTYTTLFGMYESYVYLTLQSLWAVTFCHAFCNAMGLPDVSYFNPQSPLYCHRLFLVTTLLGGLFTFAWTMVVGTWPAML